MANVRALAWLAAATIMCWNGRAEAQGPDSTPTSQPTTVPTSEGEVGDGLLLDISGSFFTRLEVRHEYSQVGLDGSDAVRYRARLGLLLSPLRLSEAMSVGVRFVPQAGGFWHVGGDTLEDPGLDLHEGAIVFDGTNYRIDLGRFEMQYADQLVIGARPWSHQGRSFDGARLHWERPYYYFLDFFFTVLTEGLVEGPFGEPFGAGDQYFGGIYFSFDRAKQPGDSQDYYALLRIWPKTDALERDMAGQFTFGIRDLNRFGPFDYRAEIGLQVGTRPGVEGEENPTVLAYQGDIELGLSVPKDSGFRFSLGGFYASGDDPTTEDREDWDQLFPSVHRWLGTMDVVGARTNVAGGALRLRYHYRDRWRFGIDTHAFLRPEVPDDVDEFLGVEVDTGIVYIVGGGFRLRAAYDLFFQNEPIGEDPLQFAELEARLDFR